MKKKNYWIRFSVLLVLIRFFSMVPVSAKWITNPSLRQDDTLNIDGITNDASKRVAYIEGDTDELGFTTIEAALAKATQKGGSQKVVVTKTSTIHHDCQISTGVELRIPYNSSETTFQEPSPDVSSSKTLNDKPYLEVSLSSNREIRGTLTIRGQFGCAQSTTNLVSDTFGQYSTLLRKKNSKIKVTSGGKIRCFGFIKEDLTGVSNCLDGNGSSIEVYSGGSVWEPLTIYDWPGGSNAANLAVGLKDLDLLFNSKKRVFPRNQFDRPNIYAPIVLNSGSNLYGHILMNMGSARKINARMPVVSSGSAFINLSSGTVTWDYGTTDAKQNRGNVLSGHKTAIRLNGHASFGSMTITLSIATINSANYSRPMGPQFEVDVINGVFTVGNKSHWFENQIKIENGATVLLTADTAVFDNSVVINEGTLNATAAFGGKVITSSKGSTLSISNNSISGYFNINSASKQREFKVIGYTSGSAQEPAQLESKAIYESDLRTSNPKNGYWAKNNNLYLVRYNLNEHVTASENIKEQMNKQMITKYYDGNERVQIVNPSASELKRSYTTTKLIGEGDDQTVTTEEHTGYATFQGWNTDFYGAGNSITPGTSYSLSDLSKAASGSHLIRLYDKWIGNQITIRFTHDNGLTTTLVNKRDDVNSNSCIGWKLPECNFIRKWHDGHLCSFDHWEISSPYGDGKTVFSFSAKTYILLDESIVDPTQNGFILNVKAISK